MPAMRVVVGAAAGLAAALLSTSCGSGGSTSQEAARSCGPAPAGAQPSARAGCPLTAPSVDVRPTGDTSMRIVEGSVHFRVDDAGLLVVSMTIHSDAAALEAVMVTCTMFDANGTRIGTAKGGAVNVLPGKDQPVELSGAAPAGTITAATVAITTRPEPTPS